MLTGWQSGFLAEGHPEPPPGQGPSAEIAVVADDYFATLRTPLLRGRTFLPSDNKGAPPVMIIDQTIADRWFPGVDPIGKRIQINDETWRTIVGVAPRLKVYGFKEEVPLPQVYFPHAQVPQSAMTILLRTALPIGTIERPLRQIVASLDPAQPIFDIQTMQQRVEETWATPRLLTFLLGVFAALALAARGRRALWCDGLQRRPPHARNRRAAGSRRAATTDHLDDAGAGNAIARAGLVIGFIAALAASRVLRSLLFEVNATDPLTYAASRCCWPL